MKVVGSGRYKSKIHTHQKIILTFIVQVLRSNMSKMTPEEEIGFEKCEKNLNHLNPPIMDLVNMIRKLTVKFNVNSLSEEKLHGLIEGGLQEAYKKEWMVPVYINPGKKEKSGWMRKEDSPVQLPTEVFVKLQKMNKQCKKISTKMLDKNFACIRRQLVPTGFQYLN